MRPIEGTKGQRLVRHRLFGWGSFCVLQGGNSAEILLAVVLFFSHGFPPSPHYGHAVSLRDQHFCCWNWGSVVSAKRDNDDYSYVYEWRANG